MAKVVRSSPVLPAFLACPIALSTTSISAAFPRRFLAASGSIFSPPSSSKTFSMVSACSVLAAKFCNNETSATPAFFAFFTTLATFFAFLGALAIFLIKSVLATSDPASVTASATSSILSNISAALVC